MSSSESRNIVVTGFGLFRDHKSNPSWDAIKDGQLSVDRPNINLIAKQVEVCYNEVDKVVESLWEEYKPLLMVHVGLAAFERSIRIEQRARHGPYIHDDVAKSAPHEHLRQYYEDEQGSSNYICKPCQFDASASCLNIDRVCERLNQLHQQAIISLPFKKSTDAGLYVCEYIYHKSLKICDRTVFIHVPDVGETLKLEDIRKALKYAIELLIDETNKMIRCPETVCDSSQEMHVSGATQLLTDSQETC